MTFHLEKSSNKLLILLLLTDLVFVFIHVIYRMHLITNPLFSIEIDLGYAEIYQYIKEYWIILLLCLRAINKSHIIYFAWSTMFMYLFLDDSLRIHESLGEYLIHYFGFQPGFNLRAQDFGELSVSILFGLLIFLFIGGAYLFSDRTAKQISKHLFILIMSLAFFGVIVDMLHIAFSWGKWGKAIWGLIEDGGEMLVMSTIVSYVFNLRVIPRSKSYSNARSKVRGV